MQKRKVNRTHACVVNLLRAHSYRRGLVHAKLLAHKMASETEKICEEKVPQTDDTTELKKHRGIPEALFLVSIYR